MLLLGYSYMHDLVRMEVSKCSSFLQVSTSINNIVVPLIKLFLQEKESLITELRKELRVSDEEHRELLNIVNADDIIRRIRCVRKHMFHL